jgi:hypothetical protein
MSAVVANRSSPMVRAWLAFDDTGRVVAMIDARSKADARSIADAKGLQLDDREWKPSHGSYRDLPRLQLSDIRTPAANPARPVLLSRRCYEIEFYTLTGRKREIPFPDGVKVWLRPDKTVELTTPNWYGPILPRDVKAGLVSEDLLRLAYWHEEDHHDYNHDFDVGTIVFLTRDNRVLIGRPDLLPSWQKF